MLFPVLQTPRDVQIDLARRAKAYRLRLNMLQTDLARRSGVSLGSLRRFEGGGEISLGSLLRIAWVLRELEPFAAVFPEPDPMLRSPYEDPPKVRRRSRRPRAKKEDGR